MESLNSLRKIFTSHIHKECELYLVRSARWVICRRFPSSRRKQKSCVLAELRCAPPCSSAVTLASVLTHDVVPRRAARADAILFRAGEAAAGRALPLAVGSFCVPDAVACHILLMLPPRCKAVCACVCASWQDALAGPDLWDTLDVKAESITSKVFLEVVRRARGQLKTLRVRGVFFELRHPTYDTAAGDAYLHYTYQIASRALVDACTLNKKLAVLSVESTILPTHAAAIFASCPAVDFVARVAIVQHSSGMQCPVGTIVGLLENCSDNSGPRVASLSVRTSHPGFWGDASPDVGMCSLASALASHKALHNLTFTCSDVLAALTVSRMCASCVWLTSFTFKDCRTDQGWVPGLGELLCAATSLYALVVTSSNTESTLLVVDSADGDSSVVEPLCIGLASSRTLSKLV